MPVTVPYFRELWEALYTGFTVESLRQMLWFRLGVDLDELVPEGPIRDVTFDLVRWAEDHDRVRDLVRAGYEFNPRNQTLGNLYAEFGLATPVVFNPRSLETAPAPSPPATSADLERAVKGRLKEFDFPVWKEQLSRVEGQVCRVTLGGRHVGTGFLVGPDLLLTNYHVLQPVLEGRALPGEVSFRFSSCASPNGAAPDGATPELGIGLAASEWDVDHSPPAPDELAGRPDARLPAIDELDYALVRLASPVGRFPRSGSGPVRGWIVLPSVPAGPSRRGLVIAQYPQDGPLKLALDTEAALEVNANRTRVRYVTLTERGSSGSPVFDMQWNLVALHHYGDPDWHSSSTGGQGVPIEAIRDRLAQAHGSAILGTERSVGSRAERALPWSSSERPPEPGPVVTRKDIQKGRWGGVAEQDGRALSARLTAVLSKLFYFDLIVRSTDGTLLRGPVVFHLDGTYHRSTRTVFHTRPDNTVVLERVSAYGVFTAAAQVRDARGRWIGLEVDLATLPGLPGRFLEG